MSKSQVPIDGRPMNPFAPDFPDACVWAPVDGYPIGGGWQADVYRVYNRNGPGKFLALKLLKNKDAKARERFHREIKAMKNLDHPRIVKIIDSSNEGEDFLFYVMPYIEGARSLKEVITSEQNPFKGDPVRSVEMFIQILEGLREWHARGLVHRDLSPNNVLLLPDNSVQIIDFGICQQLDDGTLTASNEGLGTRCYNAPECGAGSTTKITIQADIYSAAKILWSVFVGAWAFEREQPVFANKSLQNEFPHTPICWHLQEIFELSIREDPVDRWPDAISAMLDAYRILGVIKRGFPPLAKITAACPACGFGLMENDIRLPTDLTNIGRSQLSIKCCDRCGFVVIRDFHVLRSQLERKRNLR